MPVCLLLALTASSVHAQAPLRKIGEMDLSIVGVSAVVDPPRLTVPKNIPTGVPITVRGGTNAIAPGLLAQLLGGAYVVEGELSGPGLGETLTLRQSCPLDASSTAPLLLPIPSLPLAGTYTLSNLRIMMGNRPVLDVAPRVVVIEVIDQVLITSVKTRPLTLQEIKDKGIVLDKDDYLAFEFTIGLKLESKAVNVSFPVIFDSAGVPVPEYITGGPPMPAEEHDIPVFPEIVPVMLRPPKPITVRINGHDEEVRIPSVLVIPGNVGYLKQFFSAQLFVANGAPALSNLTLRDVSGTMKLPAGKDHVVGTPDDPLSLAETANGIQPITMLIRGTGDRLAPGEQGQAEYLIRGDLEGFHSLNFDIAATLEGLPTGPVTVTGQATGGVLVRNPYFDMTFTVPATVRKGERFKVFTSVTNIGQGLANDVTVTIDASRLSGATIVGDGTRRVDTLRPGDSKTLAFELISDRTGQVVASYLNLETDNGSTGKLQFTLGVGERGITLSPDTLVLPAQVDALPPPLIDAAMRVLGQAWSIANAAAGTLPSGVKRIGKDVVKQRALALAEAGLRVTLGEPLNDAIRNLLADFAAGTSLDVGFDQLLRQTDAGQSFLAALGHELAASVAGSPLEFERRFTDANTSGPEFVALAIASGGSRAQVDITIADTLAHRTVAPVTLEPLPDAQVQGVSFVPLGPAATAPVFGFIAAPTGPYTLTLTAREADAIDLSVSLPRGDGTYLRGRLPGFPMAAGSRGTVRISPRLPDALVFEYDADGSGTIDSQATLMSETLQPQGPQFVSATIVGPETLPAAGPYGVNVALLFDRIVDGTAAANRANYSIPRNELRSARRQLSGRLVFGSLAQPEHSYVPTTITVAGLPDPRGVPGNGGTKPLRSLLRDPGAVVSGRILNPDGTPVVGATVIYQNNPNWKTCEMPDNSQTGFAAVQTDPAGRYEFRYVKQDHCGFPWSMLTQDPVSGSLRTVSGYVRTAGEQIVLDIVLYGKGTVAGRVQDLSGNPVPAADVFAVSDTDTRVAHTARTDGDGRFTMQDVLVGAIDLRAAKHTATGSGATRIMRAGTTATVELTLDTGSVRVLGTVKKLDNGVLSAVAGSIVRYRLLDGSFPGGSRIVAIGGTKVDGSYEFSSVPAGTYTIEASLDTGERETISGVANAGATLEGQHLIIEVTRSATVSGVVRLPDGSPAADVPVTVGDRGILTGADGTFEIRGVAVKPNSPQQVKAFTRDARRSGTATVYVNSPGEHVSGVVVTLSGLGFAEFQVLDPAGQPIAGQEVLLLFTSGSVLAPNCAVGCGCALQVKRTDPNGIVTFDDIPPGSAKARAMRFGSGLADVVEATAVVPRDGATGRAVLRFGGAGVVSGLVQDHNGQPAFGADLEVRSVHFDSATCSLTNGVSHRLRTGTDGLFRFSNINIGPVSVTARQDFYPTPVTATGTLLRDGDQLSFTLRLIKTIAGELRGTVFLPDGVTPAGAGVEVTAYGPLPDVTVKTNAEGRFAFAKIFPEGRYSLTVRDPVTGGVAFEQIFLKAAEDAVHDLRLKGRGVVRVRVVDGAGVPVDAAAVALEESSFPNRTYEGAVEGANQGVVTFGNVFEGPFSVKGSDALGRGGRISGTMPSPDAAIDVTLRLTVTGTVRGRFVMPDGTTPIPFAQLKIVAGGRVLGQSTTRGGVDAGVFEFTYVPAGDVRIEASDPITARTGVGVGRIETEGQELVLEIRAQGIGTVEGNVTSNGTPEPGAHVDIVSGTFKAGTYTGPDGRYTVVGVPEGIVSATAALGGGALAGTVSAPLSGDGNTLVLDVPLRSSGTVTGTVLTAQGSGPAPPSSVVIQVGGQGGGRMETVTDSDGRFRFERVSAGTATITVDALGSIDQGSATVAVAGGVTTDTTVTLNGVGSLVGYARDSSGAPLAGNVTITGTGAVRYWLSVVTGPDGRFAVQQLLAGPVTLSLRATVNGLSLYGASNGTIEVSETATAIPTEIDVQLQDTGTVTGVVLRADGTTPAVGTNVALTLSGNRGTIVVQALADGRFTATGVPLGGFTARYEDPSTAGVWRVTGRAIDANLEIEDLGAVTLDNTPVAVVSIDPVDGAAGILPAQDVRLTFTDPIATTTGITIKTAAGVAAGGIPIIASDGLSVTFGGSLPQSSDLTVSVTTALTDVFGRHPAQEFTSHFRTADLSPPTVSLAPSHLSIQVAPSAVVQATFNEPIADTNLQSIVTLTGPSGAVAGTAVLAAPNVVVFTPAAPLATDTTYTASVAGARDLSGNQQSGSQIAIFKTLDTIAPTLTLQSPVADSWSKLPRPTIVVSASDALAGVNAATISVTLDPGTPSAQTATAFSLVPAIDLQDGTHTVSASVSDVAGNMATLTKSFGVDTVAPTAALVTGFAGGATVRDSIGIGATASDATSGVASITLYRDGVQVATLTAPSFQATLNTLSYTDGKHVFTAKATDRAGHVGPLGPELELIVDNHILTITMTAPAAGTPAATSIVASATTSEIVDRVEFTVGSVTVTDGEPPYQVTLPLTGVPEGTAVAVTARAIGLLGESASASRNITVDRTPPMTPDGTRISAEPPANGASLIFGYGGAVEPLSRIEAVNLTTPATATTMATANGSFTLSLAGSVDELVSITSVDGAGNRSNATVVAIRRTPSLPPVTDATTLRFDGLLVDRVSPVAGAPGLQADGQLDAVFTLSLSIGEEITRQLSYIDLAGPSTRSTRTNFPVLGVTADIGSGFLNNANGTVGFPVTGGATLTLFAADAGFIQEGGVYTATAVFTDGARFVATFEIVPQTQRPQVAHTVRIAADATTLKVVSAANPAAATLTLDDFRDIDGTRVPDGVKIALSAANMATKNAADKPIPSAGGTIVGGDPAPNNPNFRIFTISGGAVTAGYSSAPVLPTAYTGAVAVVQVMPADSNGNVIGTEAIGSIDLSLRLATDRAFATVTPTTLYADTGDRRATLQIRVVDASGNPVPDGTKVSLTAASRAYIFNNAFVTPPTVGGTILGGTTSPNGTNYRLFTVSGGYVTVEYSAGGRSAATGNVSTVSVQIMPTDVNGSVTSNVPPLGIATITLVSAAGARVDIRPDQLPIVFPSLTAQVRITHVHDSRGNAVPDGATLILSNDNQATIALNGCCYISSNSTGGIVDGLLSPNGGDYRYFTLNGGAIDATYSPLATTLSPGETVITRVQVTPGDPAGGLLDRLAIAVTPLTLVGPMHAVGTATPSQLLANGALHTAAIKFSPVLDAYGNPLPDGSKVLLSAANQAGVNAAGTQYVSSFGGQILEGTPSPTGDIYKVLTVQNGTVTATYGNQGLNLDPGQTAVANVVLLEAGSNGERISLLSLGVVPIHQAGLTSAVIGASPTVLHGDGHDRRSVVTITNFRDALGNPVPDGTLIGATAQNQGALNSAATQWLSSAGGSILGGTAAGGSYPYFRLFPVTNGQVVLEYSSTGVSIDQGQSTATIAIVSANANGTVEDRRAIATATVLLVAPASAVVEASPVNVLADGAQRPSQVTIANLTDSGGLPIPDGSLIALSVRDQAALNSAATQWITSAGGTLASAGTSPNDGAQALGSSGPLFQLFTVAGGQVRATYSAFTPGAPPAPITAGVNETKTVNVVAVPTNSDGTVLTRRSFAVGSIFLRGTSSATASGPASMSRGSAGQTITFAGIKDSAGNAVPDGTLVVATVKDQATLNSTATQFNSSAGGTILDGSPSPSGTHFKVFVVQGGAISLTYAATGATSATTVRVQIAPASADGKIISNRSLAGGVWVITLTP